MKMRSCLQAVLIGAAALLATACASNKAVDARSPQAVIDAVNIGDEVDINTKGGQHYRFAVTKITNKALYGDGYRVGYGEIERVGVKRKDSVSFLFD